MDTLNDQVYICRDLIRNQQSAVHAQRMKIYADSSLNVTEDIKNSAAYDAMSYISELVDWRENDDGKLEIKVRWLGFEEDQDTWEPAKNLIEDIPLILMRYLKAQEATPLLQEFITRTESKPAKKRSRQTRLQK